MKKIYFIFTVLVLIAFSISCTKNFDDFNTDIVNPTDAEGEFFFSEGQKELVYQISDCDVNNNIWKFIAQHWTATTYTDEPNYDLVNRTISDNMFYQYYVKVLKALDESKTLIKEDELDPLETEGQKSNKLAIVNIMEILAYHNLVSIFGDVPYYEATDIDNVTPAYTDDEEIYTDLLNRLDDIISTLNPNEPSFGGADVIYNGDVAQWMKFTNSLKLKIAINLADADGFDAQTIAEEAVAAGVLESAEDNALYDFLGSQPNTNPIHEQLVLSGRSDFVPANTIVDILAAHQDPRLDNYFQDRVAVDFPTNASNTRQNDTIEIDSPILFFYNDGSQSLSTPDSIEINDTTKIYGIIVPQADTLLEPTYFSGGRYGESNTYANYSHINQNIAEATFPGIIMTYSEVMFYIAEAAARGWSVGMDVEEAYDAAVTASIMYWNGTAAEAEDYLTNMAPFDSYDTWQEAIGIQSYIASYTRGLNSYTTFRRLDSPEMNEPPMAETGGPVPTRFTYPIQEQTINGTNYQAAAQSIGEDDLLTRLFWDVE